MKDLTCADMLHIHAVHQPSAGVNVVEAAFLGLYTVSLQRQLTRITFHLSVLVLGNAFREYLSLSWGYPCDRLASEVHACMPAGLINDQLVTICSFPFVSMTNSGIRLRFFRVLEFLSPFQVLVLSLIQTGYYKQEWSMTSLCRSTLKIITKSISLM